MRRVYFMYRKPFSRDLVPSHTERYEGETVADVVRSLRQQFAHSPTPIHTVYTTRGRLRRLYHDLLARLQHNPPTDIDTREQVEWVVRCLREDLGREGPLAPTARWWTYHSPGDGFVKMELEEGVSCTLSYGGRTDEGYATETETYTHKGSHLELEWFNEGRDCDGRYEHGGASECKLPLLRSVEPHPQFPEGPMMPHWSARPHDAHCRDYTAEAAGY